MDDNDIKLQEILANVVYSQYQRFEDPDVEKPTEIAKTIIQGVSSTNDLNKTVLSEAEAQRSQSNFDKEYELKKEELEFKKEQAEKELEFKKEQAEKELELRKDISEKDYEIKLKQIEVENKTKTRETWVKNGAAILGTALTVGGFITAGVISFKENRKTLFGTILAGEFIESNGGIAPISAKDLCKEAFKLATNVIKLK